MHVYKVCLFQINICIPLSAIELTEATCRFFKIRNAFAPHTHLSFKKTPKPPKIHLLKMFSESSCSWKCSCLYFSTRKDQSDESLWLHTQHVGIEREQLCFIAITWPNFHQKRNRVLKRMHSDWKWNKLRFLCCDGTCWIHHWQNTTECSAFFSLCRKC